MARTDSVLDENEVLLVQALDALATSGASQAIRKSGTTTLANVDLLAGTEIKETPTGAVTGTDGTDGNATFTLSQTPTTDTLDLYVNGLWQDSGSGNDYVLTGTSIVFNSGAIPVSGSKVRARYRY